MNFIRLKVLVAAIGLATMALAARADVVAGWLIVHPDLSESLVSNNVDEKAILEKAGWKVDAMVGLQTDGNGAAPLHRLLRVRKGTSERLLETDLARLPALEKAGFTDEGIVGYVADKDGPGHATVIQYAKGERKLWAISGELQAAAEKAGWKKMGVHFWFFAAPEAAK